MTNSKQPLLILAIIYFTTIYTSQLHKKATPIYKRKLITPAGISLILDACFPYVNNLNKPDNLPTNLSINDINNLVSEIFTNIQGKIEGFFSNLPEDIEAIDYDEGGKTLAKDIIKIFILIALGFNESTFPKIYTILSKEVSKQLDRYNILDDSIPPSLLCEQIDRIAEIVLMKFRGTSEFEKYSMPDSPMYLGFFAESMMRDLIKAIIIHNINKE